MPEGFCRVLTALVPCPHHLNGSYHGYRRHGRGQDSSGLLQQGNRSGDFEANSAHKSGDTASTELRKPMRDCPNIAVNVTRSLQRALSLR